MENEFPIFPQLLKLSKVFPTEQPGDHFGRQEEILPAALPVVLGIQPSPEDDGMDIM